MCSTCLKRLRDEGYRVELPDSADDLREQIDRRQLGSVRRPANVAYRMNVQEYRRLCPYVREVENDWGTAPGAINSFGNELLIQGLTLGNIFIGVQPTFGFEGDPMRLMMARGGSPHHGFMAFYTYHLKSVQRRRRDSLRHTRRAGVHARQTNRTFGRVLAGSADR